jgi:hypothetical protein
MNVFSSLVMRATRTLQKQVSERSKLIWKIKESDCIAGQGMNASMNDTHNLGTAFLFQAEYSHGL